MHSDNVLKTDKDKCREILTRSVNMTMQPRSWKRRSDEVRVGEIVKSEGEFPSQVISKTNSKALTFGRG